MGTVFRLSPTSTGGFKETVLYSFKGGSLDGAFPQGPLVRDNAGNLYGVTESGGINAAVCSSGATPGCGVIFKLTPSSTGSGSKPCSITSQEPTAVILLPAWSKTVWVTFTA